MAAQEISSVTEQLSSAVVKKRSIRGVFIYFFKTLLLMGTAIVAQGILGAKLTPADYGIYGIVVTISGLFTIISDVGLAASLIQKKEAPTTIELQTVFTTQQILAWIVFAGVVATSLFMHAFGKMTIEGVYLATAFGLSFPLVSLKTISSILLERELAFDRLALPAIVESVVFYVIAVVLALQGFGIRSYTYAVLLKAVIGVIITIGLKRWDVGLAFSKKSFLTLMHVGGKFQLNDMLAKAKDDVFYLTLAFFIPAGEFGYITWAKQWSRLPYTLTVDNIGALTFPAFSRLQHDPALLRRAIEKTVFFATLVAFPLLVGLSVMAWPLTMVIPAYAKWQPALWTLALFAFSLAFATFSTPLVNTLSATGKISSVLRLMVFWTASQWILVPILFPTFGFQTVALIAAILGCTSIGVVYLVSQHIRFAFTENIWRQTVASGIMGVVLWYFWPLWSQSVALFCVGVVVGGLIYMVVMSMLGFTKLLHEISGLLRKV